MTKARFQTLPSREGSRRSQQKELLRSLREEYKEDSEQAQRLLKTIEELTQQVKDITEDNRKLQQLIDKLRKKI